MIGVVATHLFFLWSVRARIARGDPDFTVFYTAGKMLREGHGFQLYDPWAQYAAQHEFTSNREIRQGPLPYIHPPFEALIFLPLTFLSYPDAFVLWSLFNLGMLFGIVLLLRGCFSVLRTVSTLELILMLLAFFPVFANFHQGQDAILLLLILVLAFRAIRREATFLAGCWLGFGMFKYHLVLPMVLILVLWRGRRLVLGFATVAISLAAISIGLVGWQAVLGYPWFVWHVLSSPGFGAIPYRQLPNLLGLFAGWPYLEAGNWVVQAVTMIGDVLLLVAIGWLTKVSSDRRFSSLGMACAVISAVLVGHSTNTYDLCLLVLPLVLTADYLFQHHADAPSAKFAMVLPVLPLLVSPLWFFLWMGWARINLIAIFLLWWLFAIRREILLQSVKGSDATSPVGA